MNHQEQKFDYEENFGKLAVKYLVEKELSEKYARLLKENYGITKSKPKSRNLLLPYLKVAAVIAIFAGLFNVINATLIQTPQKMAANFAKNTDILGNQFVMRKDNTYTNTLRILANKAFVEKKYEEAVLTYEKIQSHGIASPLDDFYLAVSYLKLPKPEPKKSLALLEKASALSDLSQEINWFTALAWVMDKQYGKAKSALNEIILQKAFMWEKAELLISKLP